MTDDYNPLNPIDYYQWMGEFWHATLTDGPSAGLDVIQPNYVEHVSTGLTFVPGAGQLGKVYKIQGGVRGGVSLYRTTSRFGGATGLALQQAKNPNTVRQGIRVMDAARITSRISTIETAKLLYDGDYDDAAVNWFGPPGSLLAYEIAKGKLGRNGQRFEQKPSVTDVQLKPVKKPYKRPKPSKKKPSKMSKEQKKRLWRMGLRWCKKHQRYDRCSS